MKAVTKVAIKKITIERCFDCDHWKFEIDNGKKENVCLKKERSIKNAQRIPKWCPLEDYIW